MPEHRSDAGECEPCAQPIEIRNWISCFPAAAPNEGAELPKVQLYSLGGQSVSTWGRNASLPVLPAVLPGFFHKGLPLLLRLPQLLPAYCCTEREAMWNQVSLQNNLKRKCKTLRLTQKSIARNHHRRKTLTQALEQACLKLPAIPSQQKQCFHLYFASNSAHFLGLWHIWDECAVCTYLLCFCYHHLAVILVIILLTYGMSKNHTITKHHQAGCKHCASSEQFWQLRNNYSVNMNCTLSKAGRQILRR